MARAKTNFTEVSEKVRCVHCGDYCQGDYPTLEEHSFCCEGCKTIYQLLQQNGMGQYYDIDVLPGISQKNSKKKAYDYLEENEIQEILLDAKINDTCKITFDLPTIHCSSCIWLLEHLHKLNPGIVSSRVNFPKKKATVTYNQKKITLRGVVELLDKIGYEPDLSMTNLEKEKSSGYNKSLLFKIGVAGFGFGNIMLLSFPEYLGIVDAAFNLTISVLLILLSTPVLLYSGRDYLISAFKSIRSGNLNIDVPIALGMLTLYLRSFIEIVLGFGDGYMDSLSGFIFFLLVGKWFQDYTYGALSFDRNYKSYFPISSLVKSGEKWISKTINKIKKGDIILIKNEEIVPCDAFLTNGAARIDYSFVTGESELIPVEVGEKVFAGGRQKGSSIVLTVENEVNQSYLTELWNNDIFHKSDDSHVSQLINQISKYFTIIIIMIAVLTLGYWWMQDKLIAFNAFTAVLIIACPCVLALSIPFIYGNAIRLMGHLGIFFKGVKTLEKLQDIQSIIFDKTGTITDNTKRKIDWKGEPLTALQASLVKSICYHSSHPLSKAIVDYLKAPIVDIDQFEEVSGKGLMGRVSGHQLKLGSTHFILGDHSDERPQHVLIEVDGQVLGHFEFLNELREGVESIIHELDDKNYELGLLSGDNAKELSRMKGVFPEGSSLLFNQDPNDKLSAIQYIQNVEKKKVMMIGDGLNDAGALKQSDVGIVISDSTNNFTPACDIIIKAESFHRIKTLLKFSTRIKMVLYGGFFLAFLYNTIGLYFAVTGQLSPIIAAILMPTSSISIILYGVIMSTLLYRFSFNIVEEKYER